jgi:hypothetical protein
MMPGSDRDSHGCIGSAGYEWSEVLQDCIRAFELPLQLLNRDKTQLAGVAFSKDNLKAEVFTSAGVFILARNTDLSYSVDTKDSKLILGKQNGKWTFADNKDDRLTFTEE